MTEIGKGENLQWRRIGLALSALMTLRMDFLLRQGLPQTLINTQFHFIHEENKSQLARLIIPFVNNNNAREHLQEALENQTEWPLAELGKSAWALFRQPLYQGLGMEDVLKEDLLALNYRSIVNSAPDDAPINKGKWLRAVEDFLLNEFYLLEEVVLAGHANGQRQEHSPPSQQPAGEVIELLQYADLLTQMHLQNAVNRIRAGWDKLMTNLVLDSFEFRDRPDRFQKKIKAVQRSLLPKLSPAQKLFMENFCQNASEVAVSPLLSLRDNDLHFVSHQATETFGRPGNDPSIDYFWEIVLNEHQRLEQSFLLLIGTIKLYCHEEKDGRPIRP